MADFEEAAVRRAPGTQTACRFFAQGRCRNGDRCSFAHRTKEGIVSSSSPSSSSSSLRVASSSSLSSAGGGGGGGLGSSPVSPSSSAVTPPTTPNGTRRPCSFFALGRCKNGTSCPFAHAPNTGAFFSTTPTTEAARVPRPRSPEKPVVLPAPEKAFSVDVECVATGPRHLDRAVAQIGVVDARGQCLLNCYVKPAQAVVSYLTPLTGLTAELIDEVGVSPEEAIALVRHVLPRNAVLVGTNVAKDVEWLHLKEGLDFASMIDLAALFRAWDGTRFCYFGQDHIARSWLGTIRHPDAPHDAVGDAAIAMQLFHAYSTVRHDPVHLDALRNATLVAPRDPSFAMKHPEYEGVCQGNRKLCKCGQPHFS